MSLVLFWDTSALAKFYIPEQGTRWVVTQILNPSCVHFIAYLTPVELHAMLARRTRLTQAPLSPEVARQAIQLIEQDFKVRYARVPLDEQVIISAKTLVSRYPLRAYDSVQLASALLLAERLQAEGLALTFICADKALLKAATSEALPCDDPHLYPG